MTCVTKEGIIGQAAVPSGGSTGEGEALELRDGDKKRYKGKGVLVAKNHVEGPIKKLLLGQSVLDQELIDQMMIEADRTKEKKNFGANAILGVSLAVARAGAMASRMSLYRYLGGVAAKNAPLPHDERHEWRSPCRQPFRDTRIHDKTPWGRFFF